MSSSLLYIAGSHFFSGLLTIAISDSSSSIIDSLKGTIFDEYPVLKNFMDKYDINATILIINQLMKSFPDNLEQIEPIKQALTNLHNIIRDIETELDHINIEIEYHKNERYFAHYRTPYYNSYLKNIEKFIPILNTRLDLLLKVIQMYK